MWGLVQWSQPGNLITAVHLLCPEKIPPPISSFDTTVIIRMMQDFYPLHRCHTPSWLSRQYQIKKIGKYNRIAFADFLESIVSDPQRKIISNGLNQLRISSSLANDLLNSSKITEKGYRTFIPTSLVSRKTLMHDVDENLSPLTISNRLEPEIRDLIISIRRRTTDKNKVFSMMD